MKKLVLLLIFLTLLLISPAIMANDFEFVGGFTVNTFNYESEEKDGEDTLVYGMEDMYHGNGFYFGGRYWVNEKFAAGLGYDSVSSQPNSYSKEYVDGTEDYRDEEGYKLNLSGVYGEVLYEYNNYINLKGGLGSYTISAKTYNDEITPDAYNESEAVTGNGPGYLVGVELNYPVTGSLKLNTDLSYRYISLVMKKSIFGGPHITKSFPSEVTVKLTGLRFSTGLSYDF